MFYKGLNYLSYSNKHSDVLVKRCAFNYCFSMFLVTKQYQPEG